MVSLKDEEAIDSKLRIKPRERRENHDLHPYGRQRNAHDEDLEMD